MSGTTVNGFSPDNYSKAQSQFCTTFTHDCTWSECTHNSYWHVIGSTLKGLFSTQLGTVSWMGIWSLILMLAFFYLQHKYYVLKFPTHPMTFSHKYVNSMCIQGAHTAQHLQRLSFAPGEESRKGKVYSLLTGISMPLLQRTGTHYTYTLHCACAQAVPQLWL